MLIRPRQEPELRQLAQDILADKVFTTWQLPDEALDVFSCVFMTPLFFMPRHLVKALREDGGLIYEYRAKALPMNSVYGYPMFVSAQFLTKRDTDRLEALIRELRR